MDWIELNFNQAMSTREIFFNSVKTNQTKIGNNLLSSRFAMFKKKIKLKDLNMSLNSFKAKYKQVLLTPT